MNTYKMTVFPLCRGCAERNRGSYFVRHGSWCARFHLEHQNVRTYSIEAATLEEAEAAAKLHYAIDTPQWRTIVRGGHQMTAIGAFLDKVEPITDEA